MVETMAVFDAMIIKKLSDPHAMANLLRRTIVTTHILKMMVMFKQHTYAAFCDVTSNTATSDGEVATSKPR